VDITETYISLYSGGGGLDMGFHRAVPNAQCVAFVEHEASAAALLVDHIEAELLDAAPVYTDAFTFPAERFHGLVDWIIGGTPCQPFSVAGKQLGADDPRNLWPLTLRMVGQIQPRGCFFENVSSRKSLWYIYEQVLPGLRHLGYEVTCGIFSAAEVGAPHNRQRVFILAYRNDGHDQRAIRQVCTGRHTVDCSDTELAYSRHNGSGYSGSLHEGRSANESGGARIRQERRASSANTEQDSRELAGTTQRNGEERRQHRGSGGNVGDTNRSRLQRRHEPIGERGNERPTWPPGPTGDWSSTPERLWPAVKLGFRDMADGLAGRVAALSRAQELRILGNGVVPQTAEKAFNTLMAKRYE
jgi:DNA (cytosine-5)-methyltransferase 1